MDSFFRLGKSSGDDPQGSKIQFLLRAAANELCILAALAPVLCSDISALYDDHAYCTDASLKKGAVCRTEVSPETSDALMALRKGPSAPLTRSHKVDGPPVADPPPEPLHSPPRELGTCYDFIEIYGGQGKVSRFLTAAGFRVGPPIDLSSSTEFRLLDWLLFLIQRVREVPGMNLCWALGVSCVLENPRRSKLFWTPPVKAFLSRAHTSYDWLASCAYGSAHKKEFSFISC